MATSGAQEIKKQEALASFSFISYKTRLRVCTSKIKVAAMPHCGCFWTSKLL